MIQRSLETIIRNVQAYPATLNPDRVNPVKCLWSEEIFLIDKKRLFTENKWSFREECSSRFQDWAPKFEIYPESQLSSQEIQVGLSLLPTAPRRIGDDWKKREYIHGLDSAAQQRKKQNGAGWKKLSKKESLSETSPHGYEDKIKILRTRQLSFRDVYTVLRPEIFRD